MRTLWLIAVFAGCGSGSIAPPHAAPRELAPTYELPPVPIIPTVSTACRGPEHEPPLTVFPFNADDIEPVPIGPRIADRPRTGRPRTIAQLDEAFDRGARGITGCWKWASARGARATSVDVALAVEPVGTISKLVVTGRARELVACLEQTLPTLVFDTSPRTTRYRARIDFKLAAQPAWPAVPQRPAPAPPPPERVCTPVARITDTVVAPVPYSVDDSDPTRTPNTPTVRLGCNTRTPYVSKWVIRWAIRSNRGAFQRCYADARTREPTLTGIVTIHAQFERSGSATNVSVDGAGDGELRECIAIAAREVWLAPAGDRAIRISYPLRLAPPPGEPADRTAQSLLAYGDTDAAITSWDRELQITRDPAAACRARVGIVRAFMARAPWEDDPRTLAGLRDLSAFITTLDRATAYACLAPFEDQLRELAVPDAGYGRDGMRWSTRERQEAILPLARVFARRKHAWIPEARWYLLFRVQRAQQLLSGPQRAAAIEELTALATSTDANVTRAANVALLFGSEPAHPIVDQGC
ncbi:MAG: hypothetical protein ABI867_43120 [Kofleriaceae bacterium]